MKTYIVQVSETVIYELEVQAKSAKEAQEKALDLPIEALPEPIDSNGFQIDSVVEKE